MAPPKIRNMEEFASVSGISRPTVSKYFNDPGSVRATTREKIERALERHEYRPNIFAVNQNRRTTKNIGVVVPNLADPFFSEIGRRIELACLEAGYSPILLSSHGNPQMEQDNLASLLGLKPAGVLLAPFGRLSNADAVNQFGSDVPLVLFDAKIEQSEHPFIGTDHSQSTGLMVEYLCRSGEAPCLFEMKSPLNPNANKRRNAYIHGMEQHGQTPMIHQIEGEGWNFEAIGKAEGSRLLTQKAFETNTVFCSNDRLAIGLISAAFDLGIRVGHGADAELRIAGHDDHPFAKFTCPPLTTISQDYQSIANHAVRALFGIIEQESPPPQGEETLFDGRLIMRASA